ncbi:MAG: hypothetical protein NWQ46_09600 [Spirosomaceae bacterium]|nr:hypothetical protein [Spirosomataceae bacterium]
MKKVLFLSLITFSFACSSGTSTSETMDEATVSETTEEPILKNACDIISVDDFAKLFNIQATGEIETYARTPDPNKSTCQFLWQANAAPTSGNQVMITIMTNDEKAEMPRRFSNMLRMDIQNGVMSTKQAKLMPTPVDGLGENAYHWAELDFQNFQKIKFQVDENYYVEVFHNGNDVDDTELIKEKLLEISKTLKTKL